jgi:tRNA modification GTPase
MSMMSSTDTIAAVSTAPGPAALGVVRISGSQAAEIADRIFTGRAVPGQMASHTLHYGHVKKEDGQLTDEVMLAVLRAPHSFTAEDMVEITCHGGAVAPREILEAALAAGARQARPGEFSLRAYLNGRLDLAQAEAVCDLINAKTGAAARAALERLDGGLSKKIKELRSKLLDATARIEALVDFPEEDLPQAEAREIRDPLVEASDMLTAMIGQSRSTMILKDGARVVILGRPNVGKSSLFNMLLKEERAIVAPQPGTTRDVLESWVEIGGIPVRLFDTAGLRETVDHIESQGVKRAKGKMEQADLVLLVLDGSAPLTGEDERLLSLTADLGRMVLVNKCDLPVKIETKEGWLRLSAQTKEGLDALEKSMIGKLTDGQGTGGEAGAANARQMEALQGAKESLTAALEASNKKTSWEFIAQDLKSAVDRLGQITGETVGDEVLNRIFSQFCIGK